jgi:hypothetical protein
MCCISRRLNNMTVLIYMKSEKYLDEVDHMLVTLKILQEISTENDLEYVRSPGV